jgi:hypothetical protein
VFCTQCLQGAQPSDAQEAAPQQPGEAQAPQATGPLDELIRELYRQRPALSREQGPRSSEELAAAAAAAASLAASTSWSAQQECTTSVGGGEQQQWGGQHHGSRPPEEAEEGELEEGEC